MLSDKTYVDLGILNDLFDGSQGSECFLPCVTTHTETKFLNKYASETTHIDLTFSSQVRKNVNQLCYHLANQVKITTTDMLRPTLSTFLSKVDFHN